MFRRTQDTSQANRDFAYGAITLCRTTFQLFPLSVFVPCDRSYNPKWQAIWFGLFPFRSPLLRESIFLSLPAGTKMFQFPASTSNDLCIQSVSNTLSKVLGFPIRKSPDQRLLTAPRSISELVPSFIGSWYLGIHRAPLFT